LSLALDLSSSVNLRIVVEEKRKPEIGTRERIRRGALYAAGLVISEAALRVTPKRRSECFKGKISGGKAQLFLLTALSMSAE
jgi:hypothetical protein